MSITTLLRVALRSDGPNASCHCQCRTLV